MILDAQFNEQATELDADFGVVNVVGSTTATVTAISITEAADGSVTMVNTLSDGSTETIVISADANGNPSGLTYNGVAIPLTYTKETEVSE